MRTKLISALTAAVLLTVGSAGAALAQAADVEANANSNNVPTYTYGGFAPNAGFSAHHHPHGVRQR